jgi:hypothetical protein
MISTIQSHTRTLCNRRVLNIIYSRSSALSYQLNMLVAHRLLQTRSSVVVASSALQSCTTRMSLFRAALMPITICHDRSAEYCETRAVDVLVSMTVKYLPLRLVSNQSVIRG